MSPPPGPARGPRSPGAASCPRGPPSALPSRGCGRSRNRIPSTPGLSPRGRGNLQLAQLLLDHGGSIPAWAGIVPSKRRLINVIDSFELPPRKGLGSPKAKKPPVRKPPISKPRRKAVPKASEPERRPAPTPVEAESSRQRLLEHARLQAQEHRRKARELGLCRDCCQSAIPAQTRCEACAENHRLSRRQWQARRKEMKALESQGGGV